MLPRSRRLRRTADIQQVLREGSSITTPYVRICWRVSSTPHTRIACVVGKTVHRSAVRRHKYQRWLRAVASEWLVAGGQSAAYDMVWIARPGMLKMDSLAQVQADLIPRLPHLSTT